MLKRAKYLNFSEKNQILTQISQIKSAFFARKFKYSEFIAKNSNACPSVYSKFLCLFWA